jgi:hypothetical protein
MGTGGEEWKKRDGVVGNGGGNGGEKRKGTNVWTVDRTSKIPPPIQEHPSDA